MQKLIITLTVFTVLLCAPFVTIGHSEQLEADKAQEKPSMKATISLDEKNFATEAALGGMLEARLGKIAAKNAQSAEVKSFGNRMAADHGKANTELKSLAARKSISLPTDLDPKHSAVLDRLSSLAATDFDREYLTLMVKEHVMAVAKFRDASATLEDPELKSWASQSLPKLEEHLSQAKTIAEKVGIDADQAVQAAEQEIAGKSSQ